MSQGFTFQFRQVLPKSSNWDSLVVSKAQSSQFGHVTSWVQGKRKVFVFKRAPGIKRLSESLVQNYYGDLLFFVMCLPSDAVISAILHPKRIKNITPFEKTIEHQSPHFLNPFVLSHYFTRRWVWKCTASCPETLVRSRVNQACSSCPWTVGDFLTNDCLQRDLIVYQLWPLIWQELIRSWRQHKLIHYFVSGASKCAKMTIASAVIVKVHRFGLDGRMGLNCNDSWDGGVLQDCHGYHLTFHYKPFNFIYLSKIDFSSVSKVSSAANAVFAARKCKAFYLPA